MASGRRHLFAPQVGGVILVVLVVLVAAGLLFGFNPIGDRRGWPSEFQGNGERIYFTTTSASGRSIVPRGRSMHMGMTGGGCVACHGADRGGGQLRPQFWKTAPPLTPAALFGEHAEGGDPEGENEASHGDHESYTDDTLRRAIAEGVDPGGDPLDPAMPRWSMSAEDMADLIAYLKLPVRNPR